MKKTALSIIAVLTAICGYAQTGHDALMFSDNEYEGTARTMAMGNAFTALGGDLGSIGLNPAGSAVAGYSQVTITPGLTISSNTAKGVSPTPDGKLPYFDRQVRSNMTNFAVQNIGFVLNYDTQRKSGLKSITFGVIANKTGSWNEDVYTGGVNNTTSFMASMAYWATYDGLTGTELNAENAFDYMPWKEVVGYQSGMISGFGDYDDQFVGASEVFLRNEETEEDEIFLGGPLDQAYGRRVKGEKYDYVINLGANISDFIYIGANLGISTLEYGYKEYFKETALDPSHFEIGLSNGRTIYFKDMKYRYNYSASGTGYYGKFGVIITPGMGLRIGAAIQTPTINIINEEWEHSGETTYTDSGYNMSSLSPYGEGRYRVSSPFRANFGVAYTFGRFAVISADYELCDYSQMKYKTSGYDRDHFEDVNAGIKEQFGTSHMLRIGAEIKPIAKLAVRAGYGLVTSPEIEETANQYVPFGFGYNDKAFNRQNVSLGLGYSSDKSFFADLAVRRSFIPEEYYMPYSDYIFDDYGDIPENGFAPEIINRSSLWKVALTLGWRF